MPASIRAISSILAGSRERLDLRAHRLRVAALGHPEVRIGECGDLRQVRDAEHLPARAQCLEEPSDRRGDRAADAGVDLVEDERRHFADLAGRDLDGERDPRQLAAGGDPGQRTERLLGVARHAELDLLGSVARRRRHGLESDFEPPAGHREVLHCLGYPRLELVRGELALRRELRRERAIEGFRLGRPRGELRGIRRFGERRELGLAVGEQRRQRLRSHAVLARDIVNRSQPLLDARELGRVQVELLPVAPQRARGLVDLDPRRLEQRDDVREGGIVRRIGRKPGDHHGQPAPERVVALGERILGGRRCLEQRRRMREPRLRLRQRCPFVGRHCKRGELAPALVEQRALGGGGGGGLCRRVAPGDGRLPCLPCGGGLPAEHGEAAVRVDERALHVRGEERLVRVLSMQVDQLLADVLQLHEGCRTAVDPGAAAALRVQRPAQEQGGVARREIVLGEPGADAGPVADLEGGGELGALGTGPQLAQFEAVAQEERERIQQDRLAGAGLPGQDREAAVELEIERFDDDEVADGQQAKHESGDARRGADRSAGRAGGRDGRTCGLAAGQWAIGACMGSRRFESGPGHLPRKRSGVSLQWSFSRSIAK